MRFLAIVTALLCFAGTAAAQTGPERELEAMFQRVAQIPGAVIAEYEDFKMVREADGLTDYYFTKPNHFAHPAAIKRTAVQTAHDDWVMEYEVKYYGDGDEPPPAFLRWMDQFKELDRQVRKAIKHRLTGSDT